MSFGISNNVRSRTVRLCTPELFWGAVRSPHVAAVCAAIRDAWEDSKRGEMTREEFEAVKSREKKRLPIFTFHATFADGRRCNAQAMPSGLSMYDIDHIADPRAYFEEKVRGRVERLGIVLAHVTPSVEGLRLVFAIPRGMSLAEAQRWMSARLEDANYDQSVKDLARSSFAVPEDYILYIDEERLFNGEFSENICHSEQSEESPDEPGHDATGDSSTPLRSAQNDMEEDENNCQLTFKGVPYADIIRRWFELNGGEPVQGERNDKLHRLAYHLRYITDNDEALLLQIMPRYGLSEEEMRGLVHSACQAKWGPMPKAMREALEIGEWRVDNEELSVADEETNYPSFIIHSPLPDRLPPLIDLLTSRTPDVYKAAVAHAVFPSLGAHLHRVRFRYIDNVEHEATLMNVLMAGTGAGKDCISEPINRIMADIRARDEENLRREREWKNEVTSKGANKDKRQRPEGLVIQEIDADMTNPAFVMRMAEADGHFLYTKLNEIDQFDALKGSGRTGQQFQIMCLAFDPGNRYGQTRVGAQSVTEKVTIRFNWNAATTILKGKRYFSKVLTDGPVSRINFCTIPEREIGAEMPVYGTYDEAFDEALRPYIENLVRAEGLVDCPEAFDLALRLKEECADFARLSQSRVYENLSFRANVIAYLKACVLFVANGCQWDETFEDFIRWSLRYDLACKMEFFGADIETAQTAVEAGNRKGPRNLLELLPDEFTIEEARRIRQRCGMEKKGTENMLYQWVHRKYILQLTTDNYKKLKFRSDGINLNPNSQA